MPLSRPPTLPTLRWALGLALLVGLPLGLSAPAEAQRIVEISYTPTRRAQIAVWIASEDGTYLRTLSLTQAVSLYGIGNRPGALEMNSGFRWPYGRREGVLPIWAHARVDAGFEPFRRIIFQDRTSEGWASRTQSDFSRDDHFCLSFDNTTTQRNALDAVTCASVFNSDKGRYLTDADVTRGYAEPIETDGVPGLYALGTTSLYPPRRDVRRCADAGCYDHADVARFQEDARRVMPELDAITSATPPGDVPQTVLFSVPEGWANGTYYVFVEVNVEGDYSPDWGPTRFPTPVSPPEATGQSEWDYWAMNYGYPYRGQPSIVYRAPVAIGASESGGVSAPLGYGSLDGRGPEGGAVHPIDPSILDDPTGYPGAGVDRLRADPDTGLRLRVRSQGVEACAANLPPEPVGDLVATAYPERRDAHRYAHLSMTAAADDQGVVQYDVRYSNSPITDLDSFLAARPANAASLEIEALQMPRGVSPGAPIEVDIGGLTFEAHYWIAVRALDACNASSPLAVTEYTTPSIQFTTVSPCFVATAAWGSPMADELGALRRLRDRHLRSNAIGEALVDAYYAVGPTLADFIRGDDDRRSAARALLSPLVAFARWLDG